MCNLYDGFSQTTADRKPLLSKVILLCCLLIPACLCAQRKDILMAQPDLRFHVTGERYWSELADNESYFFSVKNTTNEEYTLEITMKLHLSCDGWVSFKLNNGIIRLKPGETLQPAMGGNYTVIGGATEAKKACRMKDGNSFTFLHSATFHMTNVVNLTEADARKKREQEDAARRAREEQERRDEEKRRSEELLKQQRTADVKQPANQPKTTAGNDDFWTEKKTTANGSAPGNPHYDNLPEFFNTTDGRYFKKQNGELKEISYDGYMGLVHQKAQQQKQQQEQSSNKKLSPAEQQQLVEKIKADNDAAFNKFYKQFDDITARFNQYTEARLTGEAIAESKSALRESSTLSGNFKSMEQLQAEFDQKMANINQLTRDLQQKRDAQVSQGANMYYSEPQYQSINQGVKLIGSIFNSAKAAKEKKEAQEFLQMQRQLAEDRIKAEEKKMITGIRTDLFSQFKEAVFPTAKMPAGTLYFFAYAYDPQQIGFKQTSLYISNVFPISKYSDGTWPFKNSILGELRPLTPYSEILHGYYGSEQQAEEMRQSMIKVFVQSGGSSKTFVYKGKKATVAAAGTQDFWENGNKTITDSIKIPSPTDSTKQKPAAGNNFWNN